MTVDVHPSAYPFGPLSDGDRSSCWCCPRAAVSRRVERRRQPDGLVFRLVVLAAPVASLEVGGLRHARLGSLARSALAWVVIGLAPTS